MLLHHALILVFMVYSPRTTLAQCEGVKCPSGSECKVSAGVTVCATGQTLEYKRTPQFICKSVNCPEGTSCIVKDGRTACKADGAKYVPGEYAIPGGLKDPGDTSVVGFEDAENCRGVADLQCGIGRCLNGAPTELRRCVMWPPDIGLYFRRPICKFCWQILEGSGVEATYCQFDKPQCHQGGSGASTKDVAADDLPFEKTTGFVVLVVAIFVACAICIFGAICYQLVWRHRRGREKEWKIDGPPDLEVEVEPAKNQVHDDKDERWHGDYEVSCHSEHLGDFHPTAKEIRIYEKVKAHHERIVETSHSGRRNKEHSNHAAGATGKRHSHHKEADHSTKHHHHHHHHSVEEAEQHYNNQKDAHHVASHDNS